METREWGVGNGEWGMGSVEWGAGGIVLTQNSKLKTQNFLPHSPLPTPYSLLFMRRLVSFFISKANKLTPIGEFQLIENTT